MESFKPQWLANSYIQVDGRKILLGERFRGKMLPHFIPRLESILNALNRSIVDSKMHSDFLMIKSGIQMQMLVLSPSNPMYNDIIELQKFILHIESCMV